jgi:hypothetical protein
MVSARKRRFHIPGNDLEAKKVKEDETFAECTGLVLNDNPDIFQKIKERREGYMQKWKE